MSFDIHVLQAIISLGSLLILFDKIYVLLHLLGRPPKTYNNCELCMDQFYAIIREVASSHIGFGFVSFGQDNDADKKLQESVPSFFEMIDD